MEPETRPRRPRKKKDFIGERSFDSKVGRFGLNLFINVPREELREKCRSAGYRQLNTLVANISMAPIPEEVWEEEEGSTPVHLKVPLEVWLQWNRRMPQGVKAREAMGKALSYWCSLQPPIELREYSWIDPWENREDLETEEE